LLFLQSHRAVLEPQVGRLALPTPRGVKGVARTAAETDLQKEASFLGYLLLGGVRDWQNDPDLYGTALRTTTKKVSVKKGPAKGLNLE
jgi:hypothetical protein